MPQGSVLGPISFTLYTAPLGTIVRKYQLTSHLCNDDIQLYMALKPNNAESLPLVISNIQNCVTDIKSWMMANMLQLNMDKTGGFSTNERKPQKSDYHKQNQNWFNRYINRKQCKKSWCYIWQCFKLKRFCELHLQICLIQFIQHQQKPKVSNNRCCQDPYPSLCDVQNRLLQQPVVRHSR